MTVRVNGLTPEQVEKLAPLGEELLKVLNWSALIMYEKGTSLAPVKITRVHESSGDKS